MILRSLGSQLIDAAPFFPVGAVLGPRQSEKTTLTLQVFFEYTYLSLEEPDIQEQALNDPR